MPANGSYNRQALSQSRPPLAPTQVAPKKSTIAPTTHRRRRSSETASDAPNTRTGASIPRPSEPNLNFHLLPFAEVSFIDCIFDWMHVGVRLDSRLPRHEMNSAPSRDFSAGRRFVAGACRLRKCETGHKGVPARP